MKKILMVMVGVLIAFASCEMPNTIDVTNNITNNITNDSSSYNSQNDSNDLNNNDNDDNNDDNNDNDLNNNNNDNDLNNNDNDDNNDNDLNNNNNDNDDNSSDYCEILKNTNSYNKHGVVSVTREGTNNIHIVFNAEKPSKFNESNFYEVIVEDFNKELTEFKFKIVVRKVHGMNVDYFITTNGNKFTNIDVTVEFFN